MIVVTDTPSNPAPVGAYTALEARTFRSSALTRSPWDPNRQHAGPPIALVCRAIEQAAHEHGLTLLGPDGGGLAESVLYDAQGLIGRATQSLAVRLRSS